ncbi:MAG TPA: OmpH family outer membrane protein [Bacteroidetes bacterium]|nr:OmpH family outer membrane protein [Bacteroidota bacterium]
MKKLTTITLVLLLVAATGYAQKYAFVDTEYILNNIPAYLAAQDQLEQYSKEWEQEIKTMYEEVDRLYKKYQSEQVLLTEEMKRAREDEIINKEREVKELQNKYFGPEGELFKKRQELIKPIQDEIYNAVKEIAVEGAYAVIFDTSSDVSMLYTDPKYDRSDEVLEKLGYKD